MTSGAGTPASLGAAGQALEVGGQLRGQVGVGHRGREALVLAELRQHLAGQRDVDVGQRLAHRLAHRALVLGVQEREQQADRDGLDLGLAQRVDRGATSSSSSGSSSPSGPCARARRSAARAGRAAAGASARS